MSDSSLQLFLAILAAWLVVMFAPYVLREIAEPDSFRKLRVLFQPRWKREADFLARNIPQGGAWS